MDFLVNWLTGKPEPWQIIVGLITLLSLTAQRLTAIRESWLNYKKGLSDLMLEKNRLEVAKLKYEIEAIKKTHNLKDLAYLEISHASPYDVAKGGLRETTGESPPSHTWLWLTKHPMLGEISLRLAQIIVGFYLFAFGMGIVFMPFMGLVDPEFKEDPWVIAMIWLLYALLTYACYKGYHRLKELITKFRFATQGRPDST